MSQTLLTLPITAYDLALRFVGVREIEGTVDSPQILAMLRLDAEWPKHDEVPWCSAFINYVTWLLRLPRSKSLVARSWLTVGIPKDIADAYLGFDVVILKRGGGNQPGPSVIAAPGHVGFYAGQDERSVYLLGGNQGDSVSVLPYPKSRILGVRSLWVAP